MKPVMASLKARYADQVTWHYHEFNQPDSAKVNAAFEIKAHPEIFILDRNGRLVQKFIGVVSMYDLETTLRPLLGKGGR